MGYLAVKCVILGVFMRRRRRKWGLRGLVCLDLVSAGEGGIGGGGSCRSRGLMFYTLCLPEKERGGGEEGIGGGGGTGGFRGLMCLNLVSAA